MEPTPHRRRTTPTHGATPHLWNRCTSWALPRSWLRSSASCCRDRQRSLSSCRRTGGISPHPTPGKGQNQSPGGFTRKESLGHRGLPGSDLPSSIGEHTVIAKVQKVRSGHSSPDSTVQTLCQHPAWNGRGSSRKEKADLSSSQCLAWCLPHSISFGTTAEWTESHVCRPRLILAAPPGRGKQPDHSVAVGPCPQRTNWPGAQKGVRRGLHCLPDNTLPTAPSPPGGTSRTG